MQECIREHRMYEAQRRIMHNAGLFFAPGRKGSDWIAEVTSEHPCQTCDLGSCVYNQKVQKKRDMIIYYRFSEKFYPIQVVDYLFKAVEAFMKALTEMNYTHWVASSRRELRYSLGGFASQQKTLVYEWLDVSSLFHIRPLEHRTEDSTWSISP